ncbi:MAG: 3-ketoacyl-ACP reductase [Halanaerobiales bacterium]
MAITTALIHKGYKVAVMGRSSYEEIEDNFQDLDKNNILYHRGDLARQTAREDLVNKIKENYGQIDVLVNNAGVAPRNRKDILEITEEDYDFVLDINLKGAFFLSQLVAGEMIEMEKKETINKGMIINIGSLSSYTSSTSRGEYCISKAGVSMMTKLFADRLSPWKINVYEIRPGIILTDMTKKVKDKYDSLIENDLYPLKRWGMPEDVAKAVTMLTAGNLAFSTGEVINVDGGFHLRRL